MASKVTQNCIEGDLILIKELAGHLKWPAEKVNDFLEEAHHGIVAVESLLERAISVVGNLKRCNKDGQDFIDGSDAKKATATINDAKTGARAARIENVGDKNGVLRILIVDPMVGETYKFIIPNHEIKGKINIKIAFDKNGGIQQKILKKMVLRDVFGVELNLKFFNERAWLLYRVDSFEELCR